LDSGRITDELVVCKTLEAGGSSAAHKIGIIFHESALHNDGFEPPFFLQEFFNHNNAIYKVFVIGDFHHVVKRPSVPNVGKEREFCWVQ
jgi:hypothetical protein